MNTNPKFFLMILFSIIMIIIHCPDAKSVDFPSPTITDSCYERQYYCMKTWDWPNGGCEKFKSDQAKKHCNAGPSPAPDPKLNCFYACNTEAESGACNKSEACLKPF